MLEKAGLERIAAEGAAFDPNEHEAVMQEDGDGEHAVVADVMRTGLPAEGSRAAPGDGQGRRARTTTVTHDGATT